jgi:hypothetical protein
MKMFWSGQEKPVGAAPEALFPGKGRRFKSGRPHQVLVFSLSGCSANSVFVIEEVAPLRLVNITLAFCIVVLLPSMIDIRSVCYCDA